MLIRFSFKNFKSFKNENCLDMEATSLKEHEYNVVQNEHGEFLKVLAIYGANASGKTNALQAFEYMKNKVLISDDSNISNKIDNDNLFSYMKNDEPISFEVEILAKNNKVYKYGFEVLRDKILSEWLYVKGKNKFYDIFEREENNVNLSKDSKLSKMINIDEKTLFLNIYYKIDKENEDFSLVYNWFISTLYLELGNPKFEAFINNRISTNLITNKSYKDELLKFIKTFDLGIEDIKIKPNSVELAKKNSDLIDLEVVHKISNGKIQTLPFDFESNGTKKMFHLFDFLMSALKQGSVLFIDELDAKLHPLLTKYIINLFHNSSINVGNGQLIYSTHDIVNLNKDIFRRDEIWFSEKDSCGVSEIYSLSDYILEDENGNTKKIRNDATYNKDYLTGRYGAIPVLKEFEII